MREESHELLLRCACGFPHFLSLIVDHGGGQPADAYLSVIDTVRAEHESPWGRLRTAWRVLWRGRHDWSEVLLTSHDVRRLILELEYAERALAAARGALQPARR